MADIASQSRWFINSTSQGNKQLRKVSDYSVGNDRTSEAVPEVGEDDPTGIRRTTGGYPIEFTVNEEKLALPEIDWEKLEENGEFFTLTQQIVGGRRRLFRDCQVSAVSGEGDAEGNHTKTVAIIALKRETV